MGFSIGTSAAIMGLCAVTIMLWRSPQATLRMRLFFRAEILAGYSLMSVSPSPIEQCESIKRVQHAKCKRIVNWRQCNTLVWCSIQSERLHGREDFHNLATYLTLPSCYSPTHTHQQSSSHFPRRQCSAAGPQRVRTPCASFAAVPAQENHVDGLSPNQPGNQVSSCMRIFENALHSSPQERGKEKRWLTSCP